MKTKYIDTKFLTLDDLNQVCRIEQNVGGGWKKKDFLEILSEKDTRGVVAEEGVGNVVGYAIVDFGTKDVYKIIKLVIDKDYRRNGYGTILLESLLKHKKIKREDFKLEIIVQDNDIDSINFYKYHGYKGVLVKNYYQDGSDAISFFKPV